MQNLTHDMENVFSEVRNGNMEVNSNLVDVLFQCLDALETYVDNIRETQDEGTDDNEPIIKALNAFIASEGKGNAAPAAKKEEPQLHRQMIRICRLQILKRMQLTKR